MRRSLAIASQMAIVTLIAAAGLAGCSKEAPVGANPGTWTPLTITAAQSGSTIEMVVDQVALFEDLPMNNGEDLNFSADPAGIVIIEGPEVGSQGINAVPAIIAKAPGTATITVFYDENKQSVMTLTINVTG